MAEPIFTPLICVIIGVKIGSATLYYYIKCNYDNTCYFICYNKYNYYKVNIMIYLYSLLWYKSHKNKNILTEPIFIVLFSVIVGEKIGSA